MHLFDYETTISFPIEMVFAQTIDLEHAPHWHSFFESVMKLTPDPIDKGSRWKVMFKGGSFDLEIVEFQPPERVVFKGTSIWGAKPNFTIEFEPTADGTHVHYILHPDVIPVMRPFLALVGPIFGRWDLNRYFRELNVMLRTSPQHL